MPNWINGYQVNKATPPSVPRPCSPGAPRGRNFKRVARWIECAVLACDYANSRGPGACSELPQMLPRRKYRAQFGVIYSLELAGILLSTCTIASVVSG